MSRTEAPPARIETTSPTKHQQQSSPPLPVARRGSLIQNYSKYGAPRPPSPPIYSRSPNSARNFLANLISASASSVDDSTDTLPDSIDGFSAMASPQPTDSITSTLIGTEYAPAASWGSGSVASPNSVNFSKTRTPSAALSDAFDSLLLYSKQHPGMHGASPTHPHPHAIYPPLVTAEPESLLSPSASSDHFELASQPQLSVSRPDSGGLSRFPQCPHGQGDGFCWTCFAEQEREGLQTPPDNDDEELESIDSDLPPGSDDHVFIADNDYQINSTDSSYAQWSASYRPPTLPRPAARHKDPTTPIDMSPRLALDGTMVPGIQESELPVRTRRVTFNPIVYCSGTWLKSEYKRGAIPLFFGGEPVSEELEGFDGDDDGEWYVVWEEWTDVLHGEVALSGGVGGFVKRGWGMASEGEVDGAAVG